MRTTDSENPYRSPQSSDGLIRSHDGGEPQRFGSPIRVAGKLARDEIEMSLELHEGRRKPRRRRWVWPRIVSSVFAISAVALLVQDPTYIPGYLWLGFVLLATCWAFYWGPRSHEKQLDDLESQLVEKEFVIAEQGIGMRTGEEEVIVEWDALSGFRDSDALVLLYVGLPYYALSRRWFASEEDWQRLIIFLGHRVEML